MKTIRGKRKNVLLQILQCINFTWQIVQLHHHFNLITKIPFVLNELWDKLSVLLVSKVMWEVSSSLI